MEVIPEVVEIAVEALPLIEEIMVEVLELLSGSPLGYIVMVTKELLLHISNNRPFMSVLPKLKIVKHNGDALSIEEADRAELVYFKHALVSIMRNKCMIITKPLRRVMKVLRKKVGVFPQCICGISSPELLDQVTRDVVRIQFRSVKDIGAKDYLIQPYHRLKKVVRDAMFLHGVSLQMTIPIVSYDYFKKCDTYEGLVNTIRAASPPPSPVDLSEYRSVKEMSQLPKEVQQAVLNMYSPIEAIIKPLVEICNVIKDGATFAHMPSHNVGIMLDCDMIARNRMAKNESDSLQK